LWYGSLLAEAHEAVTSVNEKAKVLIGGLLSVPKARPTTKEFEEEVEDEIAPANFLKQMKHYDAFDVASVHPYVFSGKGKVSNPPKDADDVKAVTERVWNKHRDRAEKARTAQAERRSKQADLGDRDRVAGQGRRCGHE
jgi:hypothetical protein